MSKFRRYKYLRGLFSYLKLSLIVFLVLSIQSTSFLSAAEDTTTNQPQSTEDLSQNFQEDNFTLPRSILDVPSSDVIKVLSDKDRELYYEAFKIANKGSYKELKGIISQIQDPCLLGYIYYELYTSDKYKPTKNDYVNWMNTYNNLPVARDLYNIATDKYKFKKNQIKHPATFSSVTPIYKNNNIFENITPSLDLSNIVRVDPVNNSTSKRIEMALKKGYTRVVKDLLLEARESGRMDKISYAYYCALLSQAYFIDGKYEYSIDWGNRALKISSTLFPNTYMILGLIYWANKDYSRASIYFNNIVNNRKIYSTEIVAKAAYWNARTNLRLRNYKEYYSNLRISSQYIYNFYGILASEELGVSPDYNWKLINLSKDNLNALVNLPGAYRAFALMQFGLVDWAEQELLLLSISLKSYDLNKDQKTNIQNGLIYLAQNVPMPLLGLRLAGELGVYYGLSHLAYPVINIKPERGYIIDPLLLRAVMRRESNFDTGAESWVGAVGLMQLMPSTAGMFVNSKYYDDTDVTRILRNPNYNVDLGQRYINSLLKSSISNRNLIYVLAGWNGGLRNVAKWQRQSFRNVDDQLYFIESIPFAETKNFVKAVLTDYWIYEIKTGIDPETAIDLVEAKEPNYVNPSEKDINDILNFNYSKDLANNTSDTTQ